MKQRVQTARAPKPGGAYSQGIAAGDFVFTAGQSGAHPETGVLPEGVEDQTRQALRNIEAILAEADCTLDDVVKVTAHLADLTTFSRFNAVYEEFFNDPLPVRTTVGSTLLGIEVEIDVIAIRPSSG